MNCVAIEPGDRKHAFGVAAPDPPGCFSAGDTQHEATAVQAQAEAADWGHFVAPTDAADFYRSWLALVCAQIERCIAAHSC